MRWPWWRRETRSDSYTDELVRALQSRAGVATLADELHTLSLEASAGTVGRGFAAATVGGGAGPELEPHLEAIGRAFVRRGESVLVPRRGGFFALASHWTVEGRSRPWTYEVTISEPDGQITFRLPERRVLHFRTNVARAAPWRGRGPLEVATAGGKLMANLEAALADETGGPRGSILPVPTNPDEATMARSGTRFGTWPAGCSSRKASGRTGTMRTLDRSRGIGRRTGWARTLPRRSCG